MELFLEFKSQDGRKRYSAASPAHLLAAIRAAVESGTIKGEVDDSVYATGWVSGNAVFVDEPGVYLVIPVSDGGEDQP